MTASVQLTKLIDAAAPYWAGETEIFRTYWTSPRRTRETDRQWLGYQCSKEFWGSGLAELNKGIFLGPAEDLVAAFPKIDTEIDRHEVLDIAEGLWAEFLHYTAFADAYDGLALPGETKMNPHMVKGGCWEEDRVYSELRLRHKRDYPTLGGRATRFTEGGYCTLFSEGMRLANHTSGPHGRANTLIAAACGKVYEDEFGHMMKGIRGLDQEGLSAEDWRTLERLSVEQLKGRILMRNAQFSHPLSPARIAEIVAGACAPLPFDYAKAKLAA
jgi:hypothetical protein